MKSKKTRIGQLSPPIDLKNKMGLFLAKTMSQLSLGHVVYKVSEAKYRKEQYSKSGIMT